MKLKRTMCLILAMVVAFSTPVFAATANESSMEFEVEEEFSVRDYISEELSNMSENMGVASFDTDISGILSGLAVNSGIAPMSLNNTPDRFESNDSFTTATTGKAQHLVRANLHTETDMDYYRFEVTSDDVSNGEYYSFILADMPYNCDYGMLIVNDNLQGYIYNNAGSEIENAMFTFNTPGTYYVIVYSASGCSDYNYALYFGRSILSDYFGYESTGLTINFGYIPLGNQYTQYTNYYSYNLTNRVQVPDTAFVTKFRLTGTGNGANNGGFIKQVFTEDGTGYQQLGGIELINMSPRAHLVRQNWYIRGGIQYSMNFTWEPQIHITYDYIINPQTMYHAPLA